MAAAVLEDKASPLWDMVNPQSVKDLIDNPDTLSEPWYGQLMRGPQVLAYIVQIYAWMKKYDVDIRY